MPRYHDRTVCGVPVQVIVYIGLMLSNSLSSPHMPQVTGRSRSSLFMEDGLIVDKDEGFQRKVIVHSRDLVGTIRG